MMEMDKKPLFVITPEAEDGRGLQFRPQSVSAPASISNSSLPNTLLYALHLVAACLLIATVIIISSVFYTDLTRRYGYNGDQSHSCSNPQLYMELGYNLGLLGPNLTSGELSKTFLEIMTSKQERFNSREERVEEACKSVLLEAYAIGVKNSESTAEDIANWLQNF